MAKHPDDEHQRILDEALEQLDESPPLPRFVLAILAILIIIMIAAWVIPYDAFPHQARPGDVPSTQEVLPEHLRIPERTESMRIEDYTLHQNSDIKLVASRIVAATCPEPDPNCYADALYYFVRDQITYVNDPIDEYYEFPQETLLSQSADCDGQAILLASLMQSVGIHTRFVFIPRHVYIQALLPDTSLFAREYDRIWKDYDSTCSWCRPGETPN